MTHTLMLCSLGALALALPMAAGPSGIRVSTRQDPAPHQFEVASIKLSKSNERTRTNAVPASGRLVITAMTVKEVIQGAYGVQAFELVNVDSPVLAQRVDIEAKTEQPVRSTVELQQMLQPLLADRFKLVVHRDTREMNALVLSVADKDGRLGPKMKKADNGCDALGTGVTRFALAPAGTTSDQPACGFMPGGVGRIVAKGIDMSTVAGLLAPSQRMSVVDQTGLHGRYDIDVTYTPEPFSAASLAQRGGALPPGVNVDPNGPSLFEALRDQLGLKLDPKKMPVAVLVIDHIESLVEN